MHRIMAILAVTTLLSGVGVTRALFAQTPDAPDAWGSRRRVEYHGAGGYGDNDRCRGDDHRGL